MRKLIFILLFMWGCSPAWHLQQAEKKGAKIRSDTAKFKVTFRHEGPRGSLDLTHLFRPGTYSRILRDTTIYKDSIIWKVRNNTVTAECPDVEETKVIPCVTTTTIQAGYTRWQLIGSTLGGILFCGLMAFGAYKIAGLVEAGAKSA